MTSADVHVRAGDRAGGNAIAAFVHLVRHEVRRLLRTRRVFWMTLFVVVGATALTLAVWPRWTVARPDGGRYLFHVFMSLQLGAALLCLPAATASVVAGERESGTWESLRTVPIPLPLVALAKLAGPVAWISLVIAAAAPVACALVLLGGLSFADVGRGYAVTLAALLTSVAIGHSISLRARSTGSAAVRSVFWIGFWNVGLAEGLAFSLGWEDEAAIFSPFRALSIGAGLAFAVGPHVQYPYFTYCVVLATSHVLHSLAVSDTEPASRRSSGGSAGALWAALLGATSSGLPGSWTGLLRREVPFAPVATIARALRNPALGVCLRGEIHATLRYRIASFVGLSALLGIATLQHVVRSELLSVDSLLGFTCGSAVLLIALGTPASSAGAMPRERRAGRLDQLAMTRMSAASVYFAIWFASFCSTLPILAAAVWWLLMFLGNGLWVADAYPALFAALLLWALFAATVSTLCGALATNPVTAIVAALVILLGFGAGVPGVASMVRFGIPWWAGTSGEPDLLLYAVHPLVAIGAGVDVSWDWATVYGALFLVHVISSLSLSAVLFTIGGAVTERRARGAG